MAKITGLDGAVAEADVVIVGEGRLDRTSFNGKVVGEAATRNSRRTPRPRAGWPGRPIVERSRMVSTRRSAAWKTPPSMRAARDSAHASLVRSETADGIPSTHACP